MELLKMSQREAERLNIINQIIDRRLGQKAAAGIVGLCSRQIRRLVKRITKEGAKGIIHRLRGRKSNHKLPEELRAKVLEKISKKYYDYGPTLVQEKLGAKEKLTVSRETIRKWMIEEKIWKTRADKQKHRQWRERKECVGQMVQADGSDHRWFEDRAPECTLIAFIDDASNRVFLRFSEHEDCRSLLEVTGTYLKRFGKPGSLYVDKNSIFVTTRQPNVDEQLNGERPLTQYARAMREVEIELIFACSPQAKGRVERLFETLQDRLVKELREAGISDINGANKFLDDHYLDYHNKKFSVPPRSPVDAHLPLKISDEQLKSILCFKYERHVALDFTVRWKNLHFQLAKEQPTFVRTRSKVLIEEHLDGSVKIKQKGYQLNCRLIGQAADRKKLRVEKPAIVHLAERKAPKTYKPPADHPWRRDFEAWVELARTKKEALATSRYD